MNSSTLVRLVLHGIGGEPETPVEVKDALAGRPGEYQLVLTNPPFGKKIERK